MTTTIELTAAEFRTLLASRRPDVAMYSEFKESEHPRADDGKFATAARAGSSGTKSEDTSTSVESRRPTDSKEFKTWFHKSKVVDKHGKPLVVFHGTTKDFDSFKKSEVDGSQRSTWLGNLGSWFAAPSLRDENYDEGNAESVAESFTEDPNTQFDYKSGANVKPCYLSIRNPAEFEGHDHLLDTIDDEFDGDSERFKKHLESQNHDGIVIRNSMTDGFVDRDDWIAFHPSQIKSVWNRGTFDPKDERMNYALVRQFNGAIAQYGIREDIEAAAAATHTEPTEAQKKAGNYAKGKFRLHGLEIAIETPAGTMRRGKDANGKEWEHEMPHHYGYILRTESEADGDHVDVFIGPDPHCELAFVVDQRKPSKRFDEHKVMLGWRNEAAARKAYLAAYTDGWTGFMGITPMTIPDLREWLRKGDTSKPVAKYSNVDLFNDVVAQYTADFEQKHPRDDDGQFASSGSSGKKVTRKSVTAAELHGAKSDLPVKKNVGYHGTTREAAEAILKSGFDLSKVRPRWQNDLAVSMASSISGVQKHFGKDAKGRGEVILKITWKGRHVTDPRDLNVQAKDAKSYTHAVVKSGVDAAKSGGTTYLYNPDAIESIEIVDPDSETKKYALAQSWFDDAVARYADWITIGGAPSGDKKHAGGTPVQVDGSGRITKGPATLKNQSVQSISNDTNIKSGETKANASTGSVAESAVRSKELEIAGKPEEHGFIIGKDGAVKADFHQQGSTTELVLSQEQERAAADSVLTHNHPYDAPLSIGDFAQAARLNVSEMRAVVSRADGSVVAHVISRPENGWPATSWNNPTSDLLSKIYNSALSETDRLLASGSLKNNTEARSHMGYVTTRLLADALNIPYSQVVLRGPTESTSKYALTQQLFEESIAKYSAGEKQSTSSVDAMNAAIAQHKPETKEA